MDALQQAANSTSGKWLVRGLVGFLACRAAIKFMKPVPKSLAGKCVLITGAANGVGRLMAFKCAAKGAHVILWDIQEAALSKTVNEIIDKHPGVGIISQICDLSQRESIYAAADKVKAECQSRWGQHVSVVINNAGVVSGTNFLESSDRKNQLSMDVNCMAHLWIAKAFLPDMIKHKEGNIASIASLASYFAAPSMVDYACSKAAARSFMEGLRLEFRSQHIEGVNFTCVCPGHINTDLFKGFDNQGIMLEPDDVASATIAAVETNQQLVILPWILSSAFLTKAVSDILGYLGMPLSHKTEHNPMARVNLAAADRVFEKMGSFGWSDVLVKIKIVSH